MTYRDEAEAARAMADALERRVRKLEAENAALRGHGARHPSLRRRRALLRVAAGLALAGLASLAVGAMLTGSLRAPLDVALPFVGGAAALLLLGAGASLALSARVVAGPREAVVISGGARGVRVLRPGEGAIAFPGLLRVDVMPLEPAAIVAEVRDVRARGGERVSLTVRASLEWDLRLESLERAAGFFLGAPPERLRELAAPVLERAAARVASALPLDAFERERDRVCEEIERAAGDEIDRLGMRFVGLSVAVERAPAES